MSQAWNDNIYQGNHIIDTDMRNIEKNFSCLKSLFSGSTVPANADESGMFWYETDSKVQRYRNYTKSAWLCLLPLDSDQRIWHYRNDAPTGMAVDGSTPTDRVLGVAAVSGEYNLTPGNSMVSWLSMSHTHGASGYTVNTYHRHKGTSGSIWGDNESGYTDYQGSTATPVAGTSGSGGPSTNWRPAAAVGVLLKIDV